MILSFYRQLISRGIISGVAFISILKYTNYRYALLLLWIILTLWTDVFKIIKFKKNKSSEERSALKSRRPSWKRELKINTDNNIGSFINNNDENTDINSPSYLIPKKIEDTESSHYSQEKKKRKRAGKKVRERLARKKLRTLEYCDESNKDSGNEYEYEIKNENANENKEDSIDSNIEDIYKDNVNTLVFNEKEDISYN